MPYADTDMMQLHLDEISRNVAEGAHAVLLLDRAGWHTTGKLDVPDNITPIFLPSRAPELNPVENIWQYLRQNWLSNTVFENYDAIVDAACDAWRKLIAQPETHHIHRNARLGSRRSAAMTFGISSSPCRLGEDHLIQRQIRDRAPKTGVLRLQILHPLDLIAPQPAVLLTPTIIRHLSDANGSDRIGHRLALRCQHINLAQLRHDLFRLVMLLGILILLAAKDIPQGGPIHWGWITFAGRPWRPI